MKKTKYFEYLGMKIYPKFTNKEGKSTFKYLSKMCYGRHDDPLVNIKGWNYEEFYKKAKEARCENIDVFEVDGNLRIPSTNYLWYYGEPKINQ